MQLFSSKHLCILPSIMRTLPRFLAALVLMVLLIGCQNDPRSLVLKDFVAISNQQPDESGTVHIELDYKDAYEEGFVIPSPQQSAENGFRFDFRIKNGTGKAQSYLYKLYYRNDSYRFPDFIDENGKRSIHPRSGENFYGSWKEDGGGFRRTQLIPSDGKSHGISDYFKIEPNPRREGRFMVRDTIWPVIDPEELGTILSNMRGTPEWVAAIQEKADANGFDLEDQMKKDAEYMINLRSEPIYREEAWKRNPRVGNYSFLLVVTTDSIQAAQPFPQNITDLSSGKVSGNECQFEDPFAWFQFNFPFGPATKLAYLPNQLKVVAKPPMNKGIYFSEDDFFGYLKGGTDTSCFKTSCNASEELRQQAAFQEFFHHESKDFVMENIPVRTDFNKDEYSKEEYYANQKQYSNRQRVGIPISSTKCPCTNVEVLPNNKGIAISNPASPSGKWRKENAGLTTRHGFAYGKFRVKAKLPSLLNPDGVWNGLTNAIWMISQSNLPWNQRAACPGPGFIPKELAGAQAVRKKQVSYSEIDFEIVKTSKSWPYSSYKDKVSPVDPSLLSDSIVVTCTNWDLACPGTEKKVVGVTPLTVAGVTNEFHRWNHWYQAVTTKVAEPNDELFGQDHYYFEIDWQPEKIIWRIGPEKDQMREIVAMDASMTNVPSNQMLLVITQEYHLSRWWPMAPYQQRDLPVPAEDLIGEILEIEIE